jgi:hypothetical protein
MEDQKAWWRLPGPIAQGPSWHDAATREIRAREVIDNSIDDAPMPANLLGQISLEGQIDSVSANGADDTKGCPKAIALRQAHAIISTRKNAEPWKINCLGAQVRNKILGAARRLGRTI